MYNDLYFYQEKMIFSPGFYKSPKAHTNKDTQENLQRFPTDIFQMGFILNFSMPTLIKNNQYVSSF